MHQLQADLRRRIEALVAWRQGGKTRLEVAISSNDAATFRLISQGVLPRLSLHQKITLLGDGVHDLLATDRHQQLRMICASGIPPLTSWLEAALEAGARGCVMVLREYGLGFPTPAERRRMADRLPALRALIDVRAPHACVIGGAGRGPAWSSQTGRSTTHTRPHRGGSYTADLAVQHLAAAHLLGSDTPFLALHPAGYPGPPRVGCREERWHCGGHGP